MAGTRPTILVVDDDRGERTVIAAVLRDAGFAVVAAAHDQGARAAMMRKRFAAAIIALPEGDAVAFQRHARRRQPGLTALLVIEPGVTRFLDPDDGIFLARPFEPRRLLSCVFEMVLREDADRTPHHSHTAELGIAAARLACFESQRTAATAIGIGG